jgi:2'-5' RNA ligase
VGLFSKKTGVELNSHNDVTDDIRNDVHWYQYDIDRFVEKYKDEEPVEKLFEKYPWLDRAHTSGIKYYEYAKNMLNKIQEVKSTMKQLAEKEEQKHKQKSLKGNGNVQDVEDEHTHLGIYQTKTPVFERRPVKGKDGKKQNAFETYLHDEPSEYKFMLHDKKTGDLIYQTEGPYSHVDKALAVQEAYARMHKGKRESAIPGMACYRMGSSQVNLPMLLSYTAGRVQKKLVPKRESIQWIKQGISGEIPDLVKYEEQPHVTILYGLNKFMNYSDIDEIRAAVKGIAPFVIKFGKTSCFKGVEGGTQDVVFQTVSDSLGVGGLHGLRRRLEPFLDRSFRISAEEGGNAPKPYVPHMTLAYVTLGSGKKYADLDTELTGENLLVSSFEVGFVNGVQGSVELVS